MRLKKWNFLMFFILLLLDSNLLLAGGVTPSDKNLQKQRVVKNKKEQVDGGISQASLYGKTINVIGDSYVKNHHRPYEEAWHYLVAGKYKMNYRNYGRNGRCLVFDRTAEKWGKPMLEYYREMNDTADYVSAVSFISL